MTRAPCKNKTKIEDDHGHEQTLNVLKGKEILANLEADTEKGCEMEQAS